MANTTSHARRLAVRVILLGVLVVLLAPPVILGVLTAPVLGTRPAGVAIAAQDLEDCDLDGYDDKTGAPVPWAGFDSTRGDTIPAGWDGVSESWTGAHTNSNSGSTARSSSSSSSSSGSSSKSSSASSGSSKSSSSSAYGSSSGSTSGSTSGGSGTVTTIKAAGQKSGGASRVITKTVLTTITVAPTITNTQTVVNTRGGISVADADGAILHADSTLKIVGTKFATLAGPLDLSVDTVGKKLDTVSSDDNGRFTSVTGLPKGLSGGVHAIIVSFHGIVIAKQPVTLGPATAGTFFEALSAGFSDENPNRNAGALTLMGLGALGVVAYGSQSMPRRRTRPRAVRSEAVSEVRLVLDETD